MRPLAVFGIILLVLGALALGYQAVIAVTHNGTEIFPIAPIVSGLAVISGIICFLFGARRRQRPT
jgi:hypothetical protein